MSNVDKKTIDGDQPVRLCNYTDVYYREVIRADQKFMSATATREQLSAFRLRPGDVIITKDSETAEDIGVPTRVETSAPDLVCGYHLAIIRPMEPLLGSQFLFWSMASLPVREQLAVAATGVTRYGLRTESIGGVEIPFPAISRQRAIADFLDAETTRIDALIARKRKLSERLAERQKAIVEQALLSASCGQVPLRRLLEKLPEYGALESGEEGPSEWPRYIRITDLDADGTLKPENMKRLPPLVARPFMLQDGDLLFARSGATTGKAFRYQLSLGEACFAGYLIRVRVDKNLALPELIELWTQTSHYWDQVAETAVRATIQNVNAERYMGLLVPDVPRSAQRSLIDALESMRRKHTEAQLQLSRQVTLLQEHRQALITAAVTGELDIPDLAA